MGKGKKKKSDYDIADTLYSAPTVYAGYGASPHSEEEHLDEEYFVTTSIKEGKMEIDDSNDNYQPEAKPKAKTENKNIRMSNSNEEQYVKLEKSLDRPGLDVSKEEWAWAEKRQKIESKKGHDDFKIRRKSKEGAKAQVTHSFVSIRDPKRHNQELYCFAPKGIYLGRGEFGKVKLVKDKNDNFAVAKIQTDVKIKPSQENTKHTKSDLAMKEIKKEIARNDIRMTKEVGLYRGGFSRMSGKGEKKEYLIIDYLGMSLEDLINKGIYKKMSSKEKYEIGLKLLLAVQELHQKGVVHCDIHPGNVLVAIDEKTGKIKVSLVDFGLAKKVPASGEIHITENKICNWSIAAPELGSIVDIGNKKAVLGEYPFYSRKTDAYATGRLLDRLGFDLNHFKECRLKEANYKKRTSIGDAIEFLAENKSEIIDRLEQKYSKEQSIKHKGSNRRLTESQDDQRQKRSSFKKE